MKKALSLLLALILIACAVPAFAGGEAPFEASTGSVDGIAGKYTYTDWNGVAHEVDLYSLILPEGTAEVTLAFPEAVLAFNYGFTGEGDPAVTDDNYLASSYDDAMAGAAEGTVMTDSDGNGVADYIQVQTPYDANWNSEVLYAIRLDVIGMGADTPAVISAEPAEALTCSADELDSMISATAKYLTDNVPAPVSGDTGGEWVVTGLAASGETVPEGYYQGFYDALCGEMAANGGSLNERKYTEYSRVLIALRALGLGENSGEVIQISEKLGDTDAVASQGLNGPVWALIALKSAEDAGHAVSSVAQRVRPVYLQDIIAAQNPDGGFALAGTESDVDMTAMTLQALAGFEGEDAEAAISRALDFLSLIQNPDGGFTSFGSTGSESVARVIMALNEQGVDLNDERFVKNGNTLLGNLASFALEDGSFAHVKDGGANQIATEQAFLAMVSARRAQNGEEPLFSGSAQPLAEVKSTESAAPAAEAKSEAEDSSVSRIILIACMAAAAVMILIAFKLKNKTTRIAVIVIAAFVLISSAMALFVGGKTENGEVGGFCTITIDCSTLLNNMDKLPEEKRQLVPQDGLILDKTTIPFMKGESVADILKLVCKDNKIHMEAEFTAVTNSTFVEAIGNLYELDAGSLSGWKYSVNGEFPGYGCSNYELKDGDVIVWAYTCDMGADIGADNVEGNN